MFESIVDDIIHKTKKIKLSTQEIMSELYRNEEIKSAFLNEIRRSTVIGQLANQILEKIGRNEHCKILAIGDIKYFGELHTEWENLIDNSLSKVSAKSLLGYDIAGQGTTAFRKSILNYMDMYYDLGNIKESVVDNIIPTYGGTDGFVGILDTVRTMFSDKKIKFIFPEASFLANISIAENILGKDVIVKIPKPNIDNFFFTKNQLKNFVESTDTINIFYITPVGNPTGENVNSENLYEILKFISTNENNIVLMDSVYVGLLRSEESTRLFKKILNDDKIMNRIIFTESLSKTLGTTGIRIGWIWTINVLFNENLKKTISLKKAGFSKILNEFGVNLLYDLDMINKFQNKVYDFWSQQRISFYNFLKLNYSDLFDLESSSHVMDRQGIYVLLKVKDGIKVEDVFAKTLIIGVGINLSDGTYIRYAFGNVNFSF